MPPVRSFPESMYGKIDLDCTLYPKVFLRFFLYRAGDVFVFDCRIKRILGKHPGDLGDSVSKACLLWPSLTYLLVNGAFLLIFKEKQGLKPPPRYTWRSVSILFSPVLWGQTRGGNFWWNFCWRGGYLVGWELDDDYCDYGYHLDLPPHPVTVPFFPTCCSSSCCEFTQWNMMNPPSNSGKWRFRLGVPILKT